MGVPISIVRAVYRNMDEELFARYLTSGYTTEQNVPLSPSYH